MTTSKAGLARKLAETWECSQRDATGYIDDVIDAIKSEVKQGNEVTLTKFLSVKLAVRPAIKKGTATRNPFTGEEGKHAGRPASLTVKAAALSGLKECAPKATTAVGKQLLAAKA